MNDCTTNGRIQVGFGLPKTQTCYRKKQSSGLGVTYLTLVEQRTVYYFCWKQTGVFREGNPCWLIEAFLVGA